jgi:uncharacterized protein with FMN-binding domain
MKPSGSNKKVANGLVALSCAAVLAVYTAGYVRTRSAAEGFEAQSAERRAAVPDTRAESSGAEVQPAEPGASVDPAASKPARDAAPTPLAIALAEPEPAHAAATVVTAANVSENKSEPAPASAAIDTAAPLPPAAAPTVAPVAASFAAPVASVAAPTAAPKWKDGTYFGWGTSRHGDIQAQVVIESGRIASATISQCRTRYPCSVIEPLPPEVAQRQSPDVDYVSRATQSANAFYYAVVEALGKAK